MTAESKTDEDDKALEEVVTIGSNKEVPILEIFNLYGLNSPSLATKKEMIIHQDTPLLAAGRFILTNNIMGSNAKILADNDRLRPKKSEVFRLWCSNDKMLQLTGFKPKCSFEEGLKRSIAWFTEERNLVKYEADIYNV